MKIGHRGSPGNPRIGENTIRSFKRALKLGANSIEFDVRRCKDDIVVFHDETLARVTNGKRIDEIRSLYYEEINMACLSHEVLAGIMDIPRLSTTLSTFGKKCFLHIELKEQGLTDDVKAKICTLGTQNSVCVSAFDFGDKDAGDVSETSWNDVSRVGPEIHFALIASRKKAEYLGPKFFTQIATDLGAYAIHVRQQGITGQLVRCAHNAGLLVNAFVANEQKDIVRLVNLGVDGIMSDFPERLWWIKQ